MFVPKRKHMVFALNIRQRHNIKKHIEHTLFAKQMKPLFYLLKLLGILRIEETAKGFTARVCSLHMLYAICVYSMLVTYDALVWIHVVVDSIAVKDFTEKIFAQTVTVFLATYIFTPFTGWLDTPQLAVYLEQWTEFQISYYDVTRTILDLNIKKTITISLILIMSNSAAALFLFGHALPHTIRMWQYPMVFAGSIITMSTWFGCIVTCFALCTAGKGIADCFKIVRKDRLYSKRIAAYRCLWLQLSNLTTEAGTACFRHNGLLMVALVWGITAGLNCSLSNILEGFYVKALTLLVATSFIAIPFYLICSTAHPVPFMVSHYMEQELYKTSSDVSMNNVRQEVNFFLQAVEMNPTAINYGGFVTVDRSLFLSVGVTAVTYIIVLVQLKMDIH